MTFSITPRKRHSDANPAALSVKPSTKIEFIINLKAAKQSGLTISLNVLVRADKVIRWGSESVCPLLAASGNEPSDEAH
jgi:hypothetical protein